MKKEHPIAALIAQGEHQQLDFKFEVSDSKKIARTLSAFANTDGGRLLIGVKDNGRIAGIRSDEEYYMIEAASALYTKPSVPFTATRWDVNGKSVLEVYIAPSPGKPHLAPDKDDKFKAYIRVADENKPANEVLLLSWKKQENPVGVLLKISKPVEKLLCYLDTHPYIHIHRFCRIAHVNYYTARNILSDLMAIGSLRYVVKDNRIQYEKIQ
jgi:predicted HTH transcriptional regulator